MANKLELTWYGKDEPIRVEPRLLIENTALSSTAADPDTQNMLIHGDNLLALKALESKFAGQVKCIYIDPPYNTGEAFDFYEDNLEHSIWLQLMRPRLEIFRNLLSEDGTIWIQIDDEEQAYLKVLCDEVFGRNNFINILFIAFTTSSKHFSVAIPTFLLSILFLSISRICITFTNPYNLVSFSSSFSGISY